MPRQQQGFTLIELMIVVVIIGLLSAIAIPSYSEYVQRARRAEATAVLRDAQQFMQRLYAANNSYRVNGAAPLLPASVQASPPNATRANYTITVATPDDMSYTLTATRNASGPMATDPCGNFTINQRNGRGLTNNSVKTVQDCWR
jgi:type IV pilus assembly protein PilE